MTSAIYKYQLQIQADQEIMMKPIREIMHVGFQDRRLCVWAMIDPKEEPRPVKFRVIPTGITFHRHTEYGSFTPIGTAITDSQAFVWHVFIEIGAWDPR